MSQDVRAHVSASKRWARPRGGFAVAANQAFESIPAEMVATQRREQRFFFSHVPFPDPRFQQPGGFSPQGRSTSASSRAAQFGKARIQQFLGGQLPQLAVALFKFPDRGFSNMPALWAPWPGVYGEAFRALLRFKDCFGLPLLGGIPIQGPLAVFLGESMSGAVSDVIQNDRVGLSRGRAKASTKLLQMESKACRWSEKDCRPDSRKIEPLRNEIDRDEDQRCSGSKSGEDFLPLFVAHGPVNHLSLNS